ncbi:hypothetical protein JMJ35_004511 [Cladonia borealis]|uniref:Major facilitator superfamily (MFS) profile domain-containing protein n=1 Tax=Cladonia borealis TaxID=184061 RepID=A0AA39V8S5_9LECA|nr:hypothetical protein JMJ35_004511 [Cladonia borealis]
MANEALNSDERQPLLSPPRSTETTADNSTKKEHSAFSFNLVKFIIAIIGVFLANADTSLVVATYTSIASEFKNQADGALVLTAYQLGYSVALTVYGATSDTFGRKIPILVAYCLFGVGSLISGTASSLQQIIIGRIVSGVGGAGMTSMVAIIITDMAPLSQVAVLRSYVNIAAVIGRSVGGPVGGVLFDRIGWRWSFLGQIPITLLCLVVAMWQSLPGANEGNKKRRLDGLGLVTFAFMLTSFVLLVDFGGKDNVPVISVLAVAFAFSAISFVLVERYWAVQPMIPPSLVKQSGVWAYCIVQLFLLCAMVTILSNMAAFFARTENASNTVAALHITVAPVGNAIGAILGGHIISRTKRYKVVSIMAATTGVLSFFLILFRWRGPINTWESLYIFPASFGVGLLNSSQFVAISASVEKPQLATTISIFFLSQQMGMMIGASGSGALLQRTFRNALEKTLGDHAGMSEVSICNRTLVFSRRMLPLP